MPHVILERSSDLLDAPDLKSLLATLHRDLAATGEFSIGDFKGRVVVHDEFVVGDGDPERRFVALTIQVLEGRSDETKARVSELAMGLLAAAYPLELARGRCSFSVQVVDIHRASYRRRKGPHAP